MVTRSKLIYSEWDALCIPLRPFKNNEYLGCVMHPILGENENYEDLENKAILSRQQ